MNVTDLFNNAVTLTEEKDMNGTDDITIVIYMTNGTHKLVTDAKGNVYRERRFEYTLTATDEVEVIENDLKDTWSADEAKSVLRNYFYDLTHT